MKTTSSLLSQALRSYERDVKRLKNASPSWKPIPFKDYVDQYAKEISTHKGQS
jgi:hypothetical protein